MPLTEAQKKRFRLTNIAQVAAFCGVTGQAVKGWIEAGMPRIEKNAKSNRDKFEYQMDEIIVWLRTEGPWRRKQVLSAEDEMMLGADPNSPALERWRHFKALDAELNYKERCNTLVSVERIRTILLRWASHIRRKVEQLSARHGRELAEAMNETLEECRGLIDHELRDTADRKQDPGLDAGPSKGTDSSDDKPVGRGRNRTTNRTTSRRKVPTPKPPSK
jgi:hypothetical protein